MTTFKGPAQYITNITVLYQILSSVKYSTSTTEIVIWFESVSQSVSQSNESIELRMNNQSNFCSRQVFRVEDSAVAIEARHRLRVEGIVLCNCRAVSKYCIIQYL